MSGHGGHHEEGHANDPEGRKAGLQAAILAVFLALATILAHRAHTEGIMKKSEQNDMWAYYQAKRGRQALAEFGKDMVTLIGPKGEATDKQIEKFKGDAERYKEETEKIKEEAEHCGKEAKHAEDQALFYDIGEGLIEIGLVLTSLFFLSKKKIFPVVGLLASVAGIVVAVVAFIK
ncbi:MAG: DUF4337 family protein [Planctomycetes bacterium]|nr:DUF4337 family protein [Planctomycetota bacterium]